ncbi:MAG: ABC transporter permease [Paracoccus sp. BP8]|uniref:ABC transporter permease n=1 Tax=Paracoccus sp. J39 TaxID=935848 RepID=UPI00048B4A07|nr:ABC transporter permease [Paracoccus sp. J39]RQP08151.1 MAG: ABC transporter permease [Paracoccus sp. BP8]
MTTETAAKTARTSFTITQEGIVIALTVALLAIFSVTLPGFLSGANLVNLLRGVSVLGMLALGMSIVVIGRGLDLAMVATLVVGMGWALTLTAGGHGFGTSLLLGAGFAILAGAAIGMIVAFAEIPAVFTSLAMASVIFGFGNAVFFRNDVHNAPANVEWLSALGYGAFLGVPLVIYAFAALALAVHLLLRFTRFGQMIYAMGDNPAAARQTGMPVRPVIVAQYVISSLIAFLVGLVIVASNSGLNTRVYNSTLVYDVLLVVVLGGIGLSGGRGNVRNVIVGTLLVGTLFSGMTIMNLSYTTQNLVKSLVLLAALIAETLINPRDEQTAQQGDI